MYIFLGFLKLSPSSKPTSSSSSSSSSSFDTLRAILKICIVIGMILAGSGISIFTYVLAYPESNILLIPKSRIHLLQLSTWLIISGLIVIFCFGTASQITSCLKRRSKAAAAALAASRKKDSGIGTGLDDSTTAADDGIPAKIEDLERGGFFLSSNGDDDSGGRVFREPSEDQDNEVPLLGQGVQQETKSFSKTSSLKISF